MSIRRQAIWVFALSLSIALITLGINYCLQKQRQLQEVEYELSKREHAITVSLQVLREDLEQIAHDYSFWDELVDFIQTRDPEWAFNNFENAIESYDIQYAWIYNPAARQVYRTHVNTVDEIVLPIPEDILFQYFDTTENHPKELFSYFMRYDSLVIEITGTSVHPSDDPERLGKPRGYMFLGRIMDANYLSQLEVISNSKVEILSERNYAEIPDSNLKPKHLAESLSNYRTLKGWDGKAIAILHFQSKDDSVLNNKVYYRYNLIIISLLAFTLLILFNHLIINKIFKPLTNIIQSLDLENPQLIKNLLHHKNEFGKIAQIIDRFFKQKEELLDEMEERKVAASILKESEDRFRTLSESGFEGVIIHMNGRILDVNSQIVNMTQFPIEDLVWKVIDKVIIPEDNKQQAIACFESQSDALFEFAILRQDGTAFPVEGRTHDISFKGKKARVTTIRDISERKKYEEELLILSRAVESSPVSVIITNRAGLIEYVNKKFCETTGYLKEEVLGKNPRILKAGNHSREFYKNLWDTIQKGEEWRGEFCNRKKSGEIFWEHASISPVLSKGTITHFVAVKEDITAEKKISRELRIKNSILTDSINYAYKIQQAVMPDEEELGSVFKNNFVFFLPRDVVSGDFFWMKQIKNMLYLAVADCTGHGVPGAFMSMLGISLLNERVTKSRMDQTDEILNYLRSKIKQALHQTGKIAEQKEGMDISLCRINLETLDMQFSGAFQSIYIFRNEELIELNGDRQPIGIHYFETSFTKQKFSLQKGDIVYMFTDGYMTQIGGPREKKLGSCKFREILQTIHTLPIHEQSLHLAKKLIEWRHDWEQIDDILIIGFEISGSDIL